MHASFLVFINTSYNQTVAIAVVPRTLALALSLLTAPTKSVLTWSFNPAPALRAHGPKAEAVSGGGGGKIIKCMNVTPLNFAYHLFSLIFSLSLAVSF